MTQDDTAVAALLPTEPPVLDERGWRALLRALTDAAEAEHGPAWRDAILAEEVG